MAAAVGTTPASKAQDFAPAVALAQESGRLEFESDALKRTVEVQPVVIRFKKSAKGVWGMFITFTESKVKSGMGDVWLKVSKDYEAMGLIGRREDRVVQAAASLGIRDRSFVLA